MESGFLFLSDPAQANLVCQFFTEGLAPIVDGQGVMVPNLEAGCQQQVVIFIVSQVAVKMQPVSVLLKYSTSQYQTQVSRSFGIPMILALSSACAFFSDTFSPCIEVTGSSTTIRADQTWMMRVEVRNHCPYPVQVVESVLKLNENARCLTSTSGFVFKDGAPPQVLQALDKLTSWFKIRPSLSGTDISIGQFELKWKRAPHSKQMSNSEEDYERVVYSPTLIPRVTVERAPFITRTAAPPDATVGSSLQCTLEVSNMTRRVEEYSLLVTESPNFLFSGTRAADFKVTPLSSFFFTFQLVSPQLLLFAPSNSEGRLIPLKSGKVALPHFQVASKRFAQTGSQPRKYLFVHPRLV